MDDIIGVLDNVQSRESKKVAALDIGSNSFHLVVARIVADDVQVLHKIKQKVRLASGLDENGTLSKDAIERGLVALSAVADSIKGFEPDSVRIVATHTLRIATNAKAFIKAAKKITPYPIEVITGTEEARLIYSGVAHTSQDQGQRLIIDIGGGSTELIIGQGYEPLILRSISMGCVSYTSQFFADRVVNKKRFKKAIACAEEELQPIVNKYCKLGWQTVIGTSGTAKAIIQLANNLTEEPTNERVTLEQLRKLISLCCSSEYPQNLLSLGLTQDRQPVFAAGLAIMTAIFESFDIDQLTYSPAALREGVIYEMEEELTRPDIRERSAQSLATRYDVDIDQAKRVLTLAMNFFDACAKKWELDTHEDKNILAWAALLHEVGLQIHSRAVQRHSAYILENTELPGFNQEEQHLLATLARFQRNKIRPAEIMEFTQFESHKVYRLIALLRLAILLNMKRQDGFLPEIKLKARNKVLALEFPPEWLTKKPVLLAGLEKEQQHIANLGIELIFND